MKRILATLRRDVLQQYRYQLYAVSLFIVLIWGGLLSLLPAATLTEARRIVPAFLVVNLVISTFYFMGALALLEKGEGVLAVLVTTPLRPTEYLLSKTITLTVLGLAENLAIVLVIFGSDGNWWLLTAGTILLGGFYTLTGFIAVVRYDSINEWLMPSAATVFLLMLPLLSEAGWAVPLLFYWHPVEPALTLIRAAYLPLPAGRIVYGAIGSLLWLGMSFWWARRQFESFVVRTAGR